MDTLPRSYGENEEQIFVPNVVGQPLIDAERELKEKRLRPVFFPTALSNWATAVVASLEPEAGARVTEGSLVVVHPTDREQVVVPDVVGRHLREAVRELQQVRLRPVFTTPFDSSTNAIVASLEPEAGMRVPVDSLVVIHPGASGLVVVPDVAGWLLADAEQELKSAGLVPEIDQDMALADWTTAVVDYLIPPRGTSVQTGSKVMLIPKDSEPVLVRVPDVRGWLIEVAKQELRELGLRPVDSPALVIFATEIVDRLDPPHGTQVKVGSEVVVHPKEQDPVDLVLTVKKKVPWLADIGTFPKQ